MRGKLRGHLATLKLTTAAEQLPTVLDAATAQGLSVTVALERLVANAFDLDPNAPDFGVLTIRLTA